MPKRPARLTEKEGEIWRRLAKDAFATGTLTDRTVSAFALLCTLTVQAEEMLDEIARGGRTFKNRWGEVKINPLVGHHRQMAQRVEALMARFCLAPFGKPLSQVAGGTEQHTSPVSKWARLHGTRR